MKSLILQSASQTVLNPAILAIYRYSRPPSLSSWRGLVVRSWLNLRWKRSLGKKRVHRKRWRGKRRKTTVSSFCAHLRRRNTVKWAWEALSGRVTKTRPATALFKCECPSSDPTKSHSLYYQAWFQRRNWGVEDHAFWGYVPRGCSRLWKCIHVLHAICTRGRNRSGHGGLRKDSETN